MVVPLVARFRFGRNHVHQLDKGKGAKMDAEKFDVIFRGVLMWGLAAVAIVLAAQKYVF